MSTPTIDVRAALEAAGVRYRRSGRWTRVRAEWRDSRDFNIAIADSGGWHDHATGEHGRWDELAGRLGIYVPTDRAPRAPAPARKSDDSSDRIRRAHAFWRAAGALGADTPAARWARAYLESRGPGILDVAMRAGARCRMAWHDGVDQPCIVWPIFDVSRGSDGELIGVQREFGRGHASKRMLGRHMQNGAAGGFLIPDTACTTNNNGPLYITEGPVTGAAVAAATGCAVLVLFDTAGLQAVPTALGERYKAIVIAADNDKSGAGEKAALAAARRILLRHPRTRIQITRPADVGTDWADINEKSGPEAVRAALAAGLREPEPPKPPTPNGGPGGRVISLVPWEKIDRKPGSAVEQSLEAAERSVLDAVRGWTEGDEKTAFPTVVRVTPGVGKTHQLIEAVKNSSKPFLILCPTLDQARAVAAQIPGAHLHKGRDADNCQRFVTVTALTEKRRAPHAHACLTCRHGTPDSDESCTYMPALRGSVYTRVVVAAHGAGAEDSLLYSYCPDPKNDSGTLVDRRIACDESPTINTETRVEAGHIQEWRGGIGRAETLLDTRAVDIQEDIAFRERNGEDTLPAQALLRGVEKARGWVCAIAPELDRLAVALAEAPPDRDLHPIAGFDELAALAKKVPPQAQLIDATVIEAVDLRHAQTPIIPLKAVETLGAALAAGTAFFHQGTVVCMTSGSLWHQIIRRGGLLLDAAPWSRQVAGVDAAGGAVATVHAAQPHLTQDQFGPRLHGRGELMKKDGLKNAIKAVRRHIANGAVVITHKPIADAINDKRCTHWGRHKAFNDWKDKDRLVLWGLPLLSPRDQILQYAADRAALAEVGVHWEAGDGSTSRGQAVDIDGWTLCVEAPLPTVPDARAWLLDRLAADTAQAIGRLRAVRRDKPVKVEIYSMLPLVGHGLRIDNFYHEKEGRAADNLTTRAAVAAGVISLGERMTRQKLSDFVLRHGGRRASNTTLDNMLDEIRATALSRGITLDEACVAEISTAKLLLGKHDGDALAALREVAGKGPAIELLLWACAFEPLAQGPQAAQGP